ncbi:hypothetical protein BSKO_01001 [Bryopsis sp. KO-2023]|nr:hypothetical protein BSKO_01001 [Bryopsis sp. KO-2023]
MADLDKRLNAGEEEDASHVRFSTGCFPKMSGAPSTVPFLFLLQAVFVIVVTIETEKANRISPTESWHVFGLLIILGAWGVLSTIFALRDSYQSPHCLKSFPGVWLPLLPLVICLVYYSASDQLRSALKGIVAHTDAKWFVLIQGLRVLAVGTVIKTFSRKFPKWFGLIVGSLDMLYGISAWILFVVLAEGSSVSNRALFIWHLLGVLVIVPPAPLMMQLSLPGLNVIESDPPMSSVFAYPMALAPSLVVPMFVGLNLLIVWRTGVKL